MLKEYDEAVIGIQSRLLLERLESYLKANGVCASSKMNRARRGLKYLSARFLPKESPRRRDL